MKKLTCLFIILLFLCCNLYPVFAETKSYTTEAAHFDVLLTEDGHAEITESWTVNYKIGEFTRFRKNIYMNLPSEEYFSNIRNLKVSVDNIPYTLTLDGTNRPENHYSSSYSNQTYTYEVYFRKSNQRTNIQVSYTLENVVKCVDDGDYYLFVYRFLPNGYKDNINNLSITIKTEYPHNSKMKVLYTTSGTSSIKLDTNISAKNVSDMYKVKLRIDGKTFGTLSSDSYISSNDINNDTKTTFSFKQSKSPIATLFTLITFLSILFIVICILIRTIFNPR